ncbi:hypothetical protein [Deinococcus marmoris]|uniref:Sigma-fimbriae usher protein n=1 Tax=Deinococcus marmoris TaxID=249408 RepID=A0A1U7NWA0_9DEIO|nr:hypothetical protein [Deinococcus marmoris]OLV17177.1 hypothetical protein BOO71_0009655 [Deinococcus marmoris]
MSSWRRKSACLTLTLGLGGSLLPVVGSAALAQAEAPLTAPIGAAPDPATCSLGESLLVQLTIGGTDRGVQVVYLTPSQQLWLPLGSLTVSERNYGGAAQDCEGERYVLLRPEVTRQLDRLNLTLNLDPSFGLLGNSLYRPAADPLFSASELGQWQLDYNLTVDGDVRTAQFNQRGELLAQYLRGPLSVQLGYQEVFRNSPGESDNSSLNQQLNARASWQFAPYLSAGIFGNTGGLTGQPTAFGVQASYARLRPAELPPLSLELPTDSDIEVLLDGRTVQSFTAPAGRLTLQGLQPQALQGSVEVRIGAAGQRQSRRFPYSLVGLNQPGSFSLSGQAGWRQGSVALALNGNVLITPQITAQVAADLRGGRGHINAAAYYIPVDLNADQLRQTASLSADLTKDGDSPLQSLYTARYGLVQGGGQLGLYGIYRQGGDGQQYSEQSALGLDGRWRLSPQFALLGKAEYRLTGNLAGQATLQWQSEGLSASVSGEVNSAGRTRFVVQGSYRLDNMSSLSASAALSTPQTAGAVPDSNATLDYTRNIGPDRLNLRYNSPNELAAAYSFNRAVRGSVSASTTGILAGQLSGSLVTVGSQIINATSQTGSASLLLRTGLGGVSILLNGVNRGQTNAAGDLILPGLNLQTPLELRINEEKLPIEISYRQISLNLRLDQGGVSVYDWSSNFIRSRFATVRWENGEKAAYSTLILPGGQQFYADEDGLILLPPVGELTALLLSEDGKRRCTILLSDAAKDLTCTP